MLTRILLLLYFCRMYSELVCILTQFHPNFKVNIIHSSIYRFFLKKKKGRKKTR